MKKAFFAFLCLLITATLTRAQDLSQDTALFHQGDDPAWSAFAYNDNAWQKVSFNQSWEDLNVQPANGYGWYRLHVVIPSSLKKVPVFPT